MNISWETLFAEYWRGAASVYAFAIPPILVVCLIGILANCFVIFLCVCKTQASRRTLTLKLTLSLAATDAWSLFLISVGLVTNSYLPAVFKLQNPDKECYNFLLEALRLGSMITSILHILALTVNHYVAIAYPVKYQVLSATLKLRLVLLLLLIWLCPPAFFFCIFVVNYRETFGRNTCSSDYLASISLRLIIFLLVIIPLLLICGVYVKIAVMLRRLHQRFSCDREEANVHTAIRSQNRNRRYLQRKARMATTALLIVGTFLLGWVPGVVWFALTCATCPFPVQTLLRSYHEVLYIAGIVTNLLIISKGILNPVIYALRIPEVQDPMGAFCRRFRPKSDQSTNADFVCSEALPASRNPNGHQASQL